MQRFFSKIPTPESLRITIGDQPEFYHQVTRVLRMQVGDTGIFFEENGDDMVYIIESIDKKSIVWNRIEIRPRVHENLPNITLCQSLPNKLEKLEFILQKGVEVGVDQFVFFEAERSQKLPLLEKKKDRLAQIVTEAVEQSGGNSIPKIHYLKDTESAVNFVLSQ